MPMSNSKSPDRVSGGSSPGGNRWSIPVLSLPYFYDGNSYSVNDNGDTTALSLTLSVAAGASTTILAAVSDRIYAIHYITISAVADCEAYVRLGSVPILNIVQGQVNQQFNPPIVRTTNLALDVVNRAGAANALDGVLGLFYSYIDT